jgi:hypothetical protein
MQKTAQNVIWGNAALDDIFAKMFATGTAPIFVGGINLHLGKVPFTPTPDDPMDTNNWLEADFNGYAPILVTTPTGPVNVQPGVRGFLLEGAWVLAGTPTPIVTNTIYGYTVQTGATVLVAESFLEPVTLAFAGDYLELTTFVPLLNNIAVGTP